MAATKGVNLPVVTEKDLEKAREKHLAKVGRPTKFNTALAAEILHRIEKGETLTRICEDKHMPDRTTVNDWRRHLPEFSIAFARANLGRGAALADKAMDVLDEMADKKELNLTQVRVAEVRAKMAFEQAKCYDREQYGEKKTIDGSIQVEHTVGGIIDMVMGQSKPLVVLDPEETKQIPG